MLTLLTFLACTKGDEEPPSHYNLPPSIAAVRLDPESPYAADNLTATVDAVDLDGDALTLGFTWRIDGVDLSADGEVLPPFSAVRDQVIELEVTVSDGFAFGTPFTVSTTVLNTAPVMDSVTIEPTAPQIGEDIQCLLVDHDDDQDPLTRQLRWQVDGSEVTFTGELLTEDYPRNTSVACEAWSSDGTEESPHVRSAVVYVGNGPPTTPGITLRPNPPTSCQGGEVVVSQASYDPDGDTLSYAARWLDAAGNEVCSAMSCGTAVFTAGDDYTVQVTAFDGFLTSDPAILAFTAVGGGETFGNGVDDDCDGLIDEWISRAWQSQQLWYSGTAQAEAGSTLGAGDIDGDGGADVLMGATGASVVYVFAAADLDPAHPLLSGPSATLTNVPSPDILATGDIDGDGLDDVLLGALAFDGVVGQDSGAVLLILGADGLNGDLTNLASWQVEGIERQRRLGQAHALGDLDGDGYADAAIGDNMMESPSREAGAVYVFTDLRQRSGVDALSEGVTIQGGGRSGHFGTSVAIVGDIDGDGISELAAAASDADDGGTDAGRLGIWFGGSIAAGTLSDAPLLIDGVATSAHLGREPAWAADIDGDGLAELAVGSEETGSVALPGTIWIFDGAALSSGGSFSASSAQTRLDGTRANAALGLYGVGPALADTDGDGLAELFTGASGSGEVYLWTNAALNGGGSLTESEAIVSIAAEDSGDRFGRQALLADLDGDGRAELFTAASRNSTLATNAGALYLFRPPYGIPADPWEPDCQAYDGWVFCLVPLGYDDARAACQDKGMDLARIDSAAENLSISAAAAALYPAGTSRGRFHIGLSDAAQEGSWRWLDDSGAATYTAWATGAPSGGTSANCAVLNSPAQGQWRDLDCAEPLFFVCR